MKVLAVLNREGGTLRTTDIDALSERMCEAFRAEGHECEVEAVAGSDLVAALKKAAARRSVDLVVVGGGDGTVSAAAAVFMGKDKTLAVMPAGTMNLFARSLGVPLDLDAAIAAFATGIIKRVDVASANDQPFVHQFSIGMHAELVKRREALDYGSKWGKIRASGRAALDTLRNPPRMRVQLELGEAEIGTTVSSIGVTNNLFGEGHLPYTDRPDGGELGIYLTRARRMPELFRFFAYMAAGRWRANPQVEIHTAEKAVLRIVSRSRRFSCAIDGELCPLEKETRLRIHKGALKVLVPRPPQDAKKAGNA